MVQNLPAMQETQVQSLGQENPLEKGIAAHTSVLAWRTLSSIVREAWWATVQRSQRVRYD